MCSLIRYISSIDRSHRIITRLIFTEEKINYRVYRMRFSFFIVLVIVRITFELILLLSELFDLVRRKKKEKNTQVY